MTFHVLEISSDDYTAMVKEFDFYDIVGKTYVREDSFVFYAATCLSTRVLRISNEFITRKPYFKRMKLSTTYQ